MATSKEYSQPVKGILPLRSHSIIMSDENPPVRILEDEEGVHEVAEEGEEDGMTEEQRDNLAEVQARLIGDID